MQPRFVKLYYLPLKSDCAEEEFLRFLCALPSAVQARLKRLPHRKAVPALWAQILLREVLFTEAGLSEDDLAFSYGEHGKPQLSMPSVQFNYSHTDAGVALGFSEEPVGVDVEKIRAVKQDVEKKIFTQDELLYLEESPLLRTERFFELWTKKEAYLKMLGVGLSRPMQSFSVLDEPICSQITTLRRDHCYLSVASESGNPPLFLEKTQEELKRFLFRLHR